MDQRERMYSPFYQAGMVIDITLHLASMLIDGPDNLKQITDASSSDYVSRNFGFSFCSTSKAHAFVH